MSKSAHICLLKQLLVDHHSSSEHSPINNHGNTQLRMNTYPAEYLLHPVPVLAVYGLGDSSSRPDNEPPLESQRSSARHPPSSRTTLGSHLKNVFANKQQHTVYESARPSAVPGLATPAFKTIFVDKVLSTEHEKAC